MDLKNEEDLKNKDDLKNEEDIKNENDLKNEKDLENVDDPLPSPWKITLHFSWWLLTKTATPQLILNWKWYQASKPEIEFHMINIVQAA